MTQKQPPKTDERKFFDRFADAAAAFSGHALFFAVCVLLILLWVPTIFLLPFNTSQLIINTLTTIITFLLVALLQNTQERFEKAVNNRLQEIIDKLDGAEDPVRDAGQKV